MRIRKRLFVLVLLALAAFGLGAAGCSREHEGADALLTPDEFVLLYARLVHEREVAADSTGAPSPATPVDTLDADQIRRLHEFVERAQLDPEDWARLQDRVRDQVQALTRPGSAPEPSAATGARRRAR